MHSLVIDWRRVPWPLWAFAGLLLVNVALIDATSSAPVGPLVFAPFFVLAWAYFLLRGIRWLWLVTLAVWLLTIPGIVLGSVSWTGSAFTIIGLALLLLPSTRGYFASPSQEPSS